MRVVRESFQSSGAGERFQFKITASGMPRESDTSRETRTIALKRSSSQANSPRTSAPVAITESILLSRWSFLVKYC